MGDIFKDKQGSRIPLTEFNVGDRGKDVSDKPNHPKVPFTVTEANPRVGDDEFVCIQFDEPNENAYGYSFTKDSVYSRRTAILVERAKPPEPVRTPIKDLKVGDTFTSARSPGSARDYIGSGVGAVFTVLDPNYTDSWEPTVKCTSERSGSRSLTDTNFPRTWSVIKLTSAPVVPAAPAAPARVAISTFKVGDQFKDVVSDIGTKYRFGDKQIWKVTALTEGEFGKYYRVPCKNTADSKDTPYFPHNWTAVPVTKAPEALEAEPPKLDHLIWNPKHEKPPTKLMTAKQAHTVASKMAEQHPGETFFVLKAEAFYEADPPAPVPVPKAVKKEIK
jgi:hypothetical protein